MSRFAWPLFGLWVALAVVSTVLQGRQGDMIDVLLTPALVVLAYVGALLWVRKPQNPIGPILLGLGILVTASVAADGIYAIYDDEADPALAVRLLIWFDEWIIFVWFGLVGILLPLLFPDGKLPSRRWRPVLWTGIGAVAVACVGTAFGSTGNWGADGQIENPLGVGGTVGQGLEVVTTIVGGPVFAIAVLAALASVVVRFRRARGAERQQLKWFAYAIGLLLTGLSAAAISEAIGWEPLGNVGWTLFLSSLIFAMPLAIAVAILRHRLYDIDVVINRTLVYLALTVTLGATYFALVLLVGLAVGESNLAIAVSTLAVAALFRPLRARIQAVVDRRFYRRRYDAQQTLEAFGGRLRDELDLEALGADLSRVVRDTVQPAHVSLWLRSER